MSNTKSSQLRSSTTIKEIDITQAEIFPISRNLDSLLDGNPENISQCKKDST